MSQGDRKCCAPLAQVLPPGRLREGNINPDGKRSTGCQSCKALSASTCARQGLSRLAPAFAWRSSRAPRLWGNMPEGDTIWRTAATLRPALVGQPITAFKSSVRQVSDAAETLSVIGSVLESI